MRFLPGCKVAARKAAGCSVPVRAGAGAREGCAGRGRPACAHGMRTGGQGRSDKQCAGGACAPVPAQLSARKSPRPLTWMANHLHSARAVAGNVVDAHDRHHCVTTTQNDALRLAGSRVRRARPHHVRPAVRLPPPPFHPRRAAPPPPAPLPCAHCCRSRPRPRGGGCPPAKQHLATAQTFPSRTRNRAIW